MRKTRSGRRKGHPLDLRSGMKNINIKKKITQTNIPKVVNGSLDAHPVSSKRMFSDLHSYV